MDLTLARNLAQQLVDALKEAPIVAPPIATVSAFDLAYSAAAPHDILTLDPALRYDHALTLDKPISLRSAVQTPPLQMTADVPAPAFLAGLTITGPAVTLSGIEVRHTNPLSTILNVSGTATVLDGIRVLGDPVKGAKRGINYTGSNGHIGGCYIDDIFQPAQDTQAIYSDNMGPGILTIANCYLRAAGEVVMFGGGDPATPDRQPHDVFLTNCILDKRPEWRGAQQVKCSLELKNITNFYSKGCTFLNGGGISQGQGGYAFDFTVRNQNGTSPSSCIKNVLIEDFIIINPGSGVATFLGSDNNFPSGPLNNLVLRRGKVTGVDYKALSATHTTGRLFAFDRAPQDITIQDIEVTGVGIRAIGYFSGAAPTGLVVANLTVDNAGVKIPYAWKLDGSTGSGGMGRAAVAAYMPDAVLDDSVY